MWQRSYFGDTWQHTLYTCLLLAFYHLIKEIGKVKSKFFSEFLNCIFIIHIKQHHEHLRKAVKQVAMVFTSLLKKTYWPAQASRSFRGCPNTDIKN